MHCFTSLFDFRQMTFLVGSDHNHSSLAIRVLHVLISYQMPWLRIQRSSTCHHFRSISRLATNASTRINRLPFHHPVSMSPNVEHEGEDWSADGLNEKDSK